jgi:hypothetical protein
LKEEEENRSKSVKVVVEPFVIAMWFGLDILIGSQSFIFGMYSLLSFFTDICFAIIFQSHVTLDMINYHHTPYIKEKTMTWFSNTCFNSNKLTIINP